MLVFGAPGGETYAATYGKWEEALVQTLRNRLGFAPDRITVLSGHSGDAALRSTEANVRRVFASLRSGGPDDVVLLVLIGHGTLDAGTAKFNLVGPDLTASEWSDLLKPLPGRLVFVNTTGVNDTQRKAMIALMEKMTATPQWADACKTRDWTPIALFGDEYKAFLETETARIESILKELGLA